MSKKNILRIKKPLSPKPAPKNEDTAFVVREDLDAYEELLRSEAVAGASGLKAPAPAKAAEPAPAPTPVPSKPLTPLAAVWPDAASPKGESRPTSPETPAVSVPTPKPTAAKTVNVIFALVKPNAKRVSLCGVFNGWSPSATPLKRHSDGHWETAIALAQGCYQYKFLVDGEWLLDPAAQKNVPNQYGSLNSVIEVRA